jgi:hypothetical protein
MWRGYGRQAILEQAWAWVLSSDELVALEGEPTPVVSFTPDLGRDPMLDERLVGYWSDEDLYQGAMEAADIAFRPDGTG